MPRRPALSLLTGLGLALSVSSPAPAMTFEQMRDLLSAGVGSDLVLEQYAAEGERLGLSSAQVLELKQAGATDALLRAVITGELPKRGAPSSRSSSNLDFYVDPFGYHLYSWPSAFAYYCPTPGWQFSLYYGGYCGWRWRDWDWCDWGRWTWPADRFACGPRWSAWHGGYARQERWGGARSWERSPHGAGGWDRTHAAHENWAGPRWEGHDAPTGAPTARSVDRFRDPARSRHANSRGPERPRSGDRSPCRAHAR